VVRLRKQDTEERKEQEAILETYLQALGMRRDRFPGEVRMIDIGHLMHMEELKLRVGEVEELLPAVALHPGIAVFPRGAAPVAGHVRALGAGIGAADGAMRRRT